MRRALLWLALAGVLCLLISCAPTEPAREPLSLPFRGVKLTVGMAAEDLTARLGDDFLVDESESCAGGGRDLMYTYPSVRIYVFVPERGVAVLQSVSYTDDGVATAEGLRIGSTRQEVIAALGEASDATEEALIYRAGEAEMVFRLREGIVRGIELREA